MTAWTAPKTYTGGAALTSAELNTYLRDDTLNLDERFLLIGQTANSALLGKLKSAPYGCVLKRTATQSISNATNEVITFPSGSTTEELDDDSFHDGATNTSRLTVPTGGAGWYDIGACVQFAANTTGRRETWIELNGSAGTGTPILMVAQDAPPTAQAVLNPSGFYLLAAGDYLTLNVYQNSTVALNVQANNYSVRFWAMRRFSV